MQTVAMHISNGIINGQVSAAFALVAAVGVAICVLRAVATSTTGSRRWPGWSRRSSSPSRC